MTFTDLIVLSSGSYFFYHGELSKVLWTEDIKEEVEIDVKDKSSGKLKREKRTSRHTAIAFITDSGKTTTYRSGWPRPEECVFPEFFV